MTEHIPAPVSEQEPADVPMSRRLWWLYPLAMIGLNTVWGGVLVVLLAKQVAFAVPDPAASAGVLGMVIAVGSVSAVLAQPLLGRLSDRTPSTFLGRRNIWIAGGAVAGVGGLAILAFVQNPIVLAIVWALVMWPLNGLQAALTAVLPERVPVRLRGSMSGVIGATANLGIFAGIAIAGLTSVIAVAYLGIGAVLLATALLFAFGTKDYVPSAPVSSLTRDEKRQAAKFPGFRTAPNFWWTFVGRFLIILGYWLTSGFLLYALRDYIKVGDGSIEAASTALVGLQGVSTLVLIIAAIGGGILADRLDRTRLFAGLTGVLVAPAALIFIFWPTLTGAYVAMAVLAFAFGSFMAIDQALISRVLPSLDNAARDLGVMNVANAGPQIAGPAVAGLVIASTGSYQLLFTFTAILVVLGGLAIRFVKGIR